jgi:hypothetical protein
LAATKYDKYITTECVKPNPKTAGAYVTSTRHIESFGGGELSIDAIYINSPHRMISQPHKHEFAQYLSFYSANAQDATDFDAEIEVTLGGELEKHVVTCPTSIYIPAGLSHGPLDFVRVGKPVLFLDIALTGKYSRVGNTPD